MLQHLLSLAYLRWNEFYSTIKSSSEVIPIQIQSALISALISWWITTYRSKMKETFDLHREFNTDLYSNRIQAEKFIKTANNRNISLSELYSKDPDASKDLLLVIRFYERLYFAIHYGQVNVKVTSSLFGDVFFWWYIFSFKEQFISTSTSWQSKDNMESLYKWFVQKSSKEAVLKWTKNAEGELETFLKSKLETR